MYSLQKFLWYLDRLVLESIISAIYPALNFHTIVSAKVIDFACFPIPKMPMISVLGTSFSVLIGCPAVMAMVPLFAFYRKLT